MVAVCDNGMTVFPVVSTSNGCGHYKQQYKYYLTSSNIS